MWVKSKFALTFLVSAFYFGFSTCVFAEFLELPEVKEMPNPKARTLLRDIDIPPLRERSPDPNAGPRVAVSEFRIQGLVEYPELGITREALAELVEKIRFDLMSEGKQLESGYTIQELGQVSDLLVDIEQETLERHVTPSDVQRLVFLIRDQLSKRGITIGQIETVANRITTFYRERGFILAKAYIPKQQVRDGVVNLTLLLGMLGDVNVNTGANNVYKADQIKSAFDDLMTKPVTSAAVEERLFLINDFPGLTVDGYFEPGYQVGDTRLNINIRQETAWNVNLRLDNHGTEETGRYRAYADFQTNNLLGNADYLQAAILYATQPANTEYYRVLYETNIFSPRLKLLLEQSRNQFTVEDRSQTVAFNVSGDVTVNAVTGKYVFHHTRTEDTNTEIRYEDLYSKTQLGDYVDPSGANDDKLRNLSLGYNYDFLQEEKSRLHQGSIKITKGTFVSGEEPNQDTSYHILNANYSLLTFWKIPFFDSNSRVVFRTNLQYSTANKLPPAMLFAVGGPTRVRAFASNVFNGDYGLYAGVDWVFNSPDLFDFTLFGSNFKDIAKPVVFFDAAYGVQKTLVQDYDNSKISLTGAGIGLQFAYEKRFSGNLQVAFPLGDSYQTSNVVDTGIKKNSSRLVFDFQYSF